MLVQSLGVIIENSFAVEVVDIVGSSSPFDEGLQYEETNEIVSNSRYWSSILV